MNREKVINAIKNFDKLKILVIGDLILDIYSFGSVERISPEAPVQIFEIESESKSLGGAGNVLNNLLELTAKPTICSVVGSDENGKTIKNMIKEKKVNTKAIFFTKKARFSIKNRLISTDYNHQVLRIDRETRESIDKNSEKEIIAFLQKNIDKFDAVIISDYLKGLLTDSLLENIIKIANKKDKKVIVDPKGKNFEKYKNATLLTPNRKEAEIASGINITDSQSLKKAGEKLLNSLNIKALLITLGKDGMAFFTKNTFFKIDAKAKEVYDVSGAGDTAIATLTVAIASNLDWHDAIELANTAAGIVVGKVGTQPVTKKELLNEIDNSYFKNKKIISAEEAAQITNDAKNNGERVVFTNGCFDLLHIGHTDLLKKAKKLGDILIVGLNSDKSVQKLKGKNRPIINEDQRANILASLESVDYIVIFNEDTPLNLIKKIKPDILVKGKDYKKEDVVGKDIVESYGGKVELVDLLEGVSTSIIVDKITKNKEV